MIYTVKAISAISTDGPAVITDVDVKSRTVEGYFSIFGNIDSDGDMIMPGAYTKTLQENGKRIKHLWQHDPRYPLSRPALEENQIGLKFRSIISDTSFGRDAIKLYEDGVIDEHSVGIQTIKRQKRTSYSEITEAKMWEGSSVTWGANALSIGGMAKSMVKDDIIKRMDVIYKALRHGRFESEELFEQLDIYHTQLKQLIIDLSVATPAAVEAPEPDEVKSNNENIEIKLNSLIELFK